MTYPVASSSQSPYQVSRSVQGLHPIHLPRFPQGGVVEQDAARHSPSMQPLSQTHGKPHSRTEQTQQTPQ